MARALAPTSEDKIEPACMWAVPIEPEATVEEITAPAAILPLTMARSEMWAGPTVFAMLRPVTVSKIKTSSVAKAIPHSQKLRFYGQFAHYSSL